jgi:hypothetical protein
VPATSAVQVDHLQGTLTEPAALAQPRDRETVVAVGSAVHRREDVRPVELQAPPQRDRPPAVVPGHATGAAQRDPGVHVGEHRLHLVAVQQPHAPAGRRPGPHRHRVRAHPHVASAGGDAVAEAAVDARLAGAQRRDWLAALGHVVELGAHHRRQQAAAGVVGAHADPRDRCHRQHGPSGHRQLARERGGGTHQRCAGVHPQRAPRAVTGSGDGPRGVVGGRAVDRRTEQRVRGAQLIGLERVDGERHRQAGLPTS